MIQAASLLAVSGSANRVKNPLEKKELRRGKCVLRAEQLAQMSAEDEDTTTRRFMEYLGAQDDGYEGSYEEWHWEVYGAEAYIAAIRRLETPKMEPEQVSSLCTLLTFSNQ